MEHQPARPHAVALVIGNGEPDLPLRLAPCEDRRHALGVDIENQFGRARRRFLFHFQIIIHADRKIVLHRNGGRLRPDDVQRAMAARRIAQRNVFGDHGAALNFDGATAPLAGPTTAGNKDNPGEQMARLYNQTPIRPAVLANIHASTRGQRGPVQNQGGQAIATVSNTQVVHQHVRVGQDHLAGLALRAVDPGFGRSRRQCAAPHGGVFPGAPTAFPIGRRSRP